MSTREKWTFAVAAFFSSLLEISVFWLDLGTDTKVSLQQNFDESCLHIDLATLNESMCSSNVTECSLAKSLIPQLSSFSLTISFLPWCLGFIIVCSKRDSFRKLLDHVAGEQKSSPKYSLIFFVGFLFFPITVFLLLAYFQFKVNVMLRNKTGMMTGVLASFHKKQ